MKKKLPGFLDTIIYTELRYLLLMLFVGVVCMLNGIKHYVDLTQYNEIPQENLESVEGVLEKCKLIKSRSIDYINIELQDGKNYVIRGCFYSYHDWESFLEKCKKGDKINLLVWNEKGNLIIEIKCNGKEYQSFDGANQLYQAYKQSEIPLTKTLIIGGVIYTFLTLIVLVLRKIL